MKLKKVSMSQLKQLITQLETKRKLEAASKPVKPPKVAGAAPKAPKLEAPKSTLPSDAEFEKEDA